MDKLKAQTLHHEFDAMIKAWAESHNMVIRTASCSFDNNVFNYKVNVFESDGNGNIRMDKWDREAMIQTMQNQGYPELNPIGKKFYTMDRRPKLMLITGFERGKRYPWQCVEVGTGKEYTYSIDWFDWAHPQD